jgi:regulator of sigma E protease
MLTTLAFIVAIGLLVGVHEWGHFAMARWCGVKVLRFAIGIGPRVMGWTSPKTGIKYMVGLLPLGGYVKMLDEEEGDVDPAERHRAFNKQPLRYKAAIVAAGPLTNLVFAVVLYSVLHWVGVTQPQAILSKPVEGSVAAAAGFLGGEQVVRAGFEGDEELQSVVSYESFNWWLTRGALEQKNLLVEYKLPHSDGIRQTVVSLARVDAREADASLLRKIGFLGPYTEPRIRDVQPDGAAARAGLQDNDRVERINGVAVIDGPQLYALIRNSGQGGVVIPQVWEINRDGKPQSVAVTPMLVQEGTESFGRIGVAIGGPAAMTVVRYGPLDGVSRAVVRTWEVSLLSLQMMKKIVLGQASLKNLSGPLTIADYAGQSAQRGLTAFVVFLALVSISLGVLNLLPIPVLDGGHLMYYGWEYITGKPVSHIWAKRLQWVGLTLLMLMMSVAITNDLAHYGLTTWIQPLIAKVSTFL